MKKLNNFMKSRAFIITLTLTFIALIIAGVTYAWFTWTSTDNTNITMQIGEYTTVTYTGGNAININNLAPVYNYTDGESTTFSLTNSNTDVFKEFKYNVYLDITTIANELKSTSLKYVLLDGSSNIVDQGDFSTASNGSTLTITENKTLPNGNSSYTFIIYIDGNEQNNPNMMNKSLSGSLRVVVNREDVIIERHVTTSDDFEYRLFNKEDTEYDTDYILLTKYIGDHVKIEVPNTMMVDGKEYKTVFFLPSPPRGTFYGNSNIVDVILPSEYLASVYYTDYTDINLINDSMDNMFRDCTALVNAPEIPTSVTKLKNTFYNCTSLVNAPEIPSTVTEMGGAFAFCTNLTGTIRIYSKNVYGMYGEVWNNTNRGFYPFYNTVKHITVEVPAGSTTYTNMNTLKPDNVTVTTFTPE